MAEMTLKRRGEFQRATLEILVKADGPLQASELLKRLEKLLPPTPFEAAFYPNHPKIRRYEKIARFFSIGPVKAGWITKTKGFWAITDEGRKVIAKYHDPEELAKREHELYQEWKLSQPNDEEAESDVAQAISSLEEAEEAAWSTIQEYLGAMNPYDFQKLVASLIRAMGYHIDWIAPPGPDEGIDIVALTDPLGINGPRMKVQVKRRIDTKVDSSEFASFLSCLGENDRGVYVSLGGFSTEAAKSSRRQEKRQVTFIDAEKLFDLWVEHYSKIDEEGKNLLPLKAIHYLATKPG